MDLNERPKRSVRNTLLVRRGVQGERHDLLEHCWDFSFVVRAVVQLVDAGGREARAFRLAKGGSGHFEGLLLALVGEHILVVAPLFHELLTAETLDDV